MRTNTEKTTVTKKPLVKLAKKTASPAAPKKVVTVEQRHKMISEQAYYLSEKKGFDPSFTDECWLQAEKMVDAMILDA